MSRDIDADELAHDAERRAARSAGANARQAEEHANRVVGPATYEGAMTLGAWPVLRVGDLASIRGSTRERYRVVGFECDDTRVVVLEELRGPDLFTRDRFAVYRWRVCWPRGAK